MAEDKKNTSNENVTYTKDKIWAIIGCTLCICALFVPYVGFTLPTGFILFGGGISLINLCIALCMITTIKKKQYARLLILSILYIVMHLYALMIVGLKAFDGMTIGPGFYLMFASPVIVMISSAKMIHRSKPRKE